MSKLDPTRQGYADAVMAQSLMTLIGSAPLVGAPPAPVWTRPSAAPKAAGAEPVQPAVDIPASAFDAAARKAGRWERYQQRGGKWSYERWSKVYEANQTRASSANAAADAFQKELGWGRREVEVDVEGVPRRLDIADVLTRRGYEHKTGAQFLTEDVAWEIERDRILREQGWDIRWRFEGTASKPLLKALKEAGIPVEQPAVVR